MKVIHIVYFFVSLHQPVTKDQKTKSFALLYVDVAIQKRSDVMASSLFELLQ